MQVTNPEVLKGYEKRWKDLETFLELGEVKYVATPFRYVCFGHARLRVILSLSGPNPGTALAELEYHTDGIVGSTKRLEIKNFTHFHLGHGDLSHGYLTE